MGQGQLRGHLIGLLKVLAPAPKGRPPALNFSRLARLGFGLALAPTLPLLLGSECARPSRPSIVLIVADDLGWNDVSYHGGEIPTPNIDRLAAEGVQLDRFYTNVNCSPTRMGLLTGRYPIRWGMMQYWIRSWMRHGLPREEETLAEMLGFEGYAERVAIGKWHVGHLDRTLHPLRQGFTTFFGQYLGIADHFTHEWLGQPDWHYDYEPVDVAGHYTTDLVATGAWLQILDLAARHRAGTPFFLYVSFTAPHTPLQAPQHCLDRTAALFEDPSRRSFAAMVSCLDDGIGAILHALEHTAIADETIVWFLSDNGGAEPESNAPLRGAKNTVYEGGIRVPSVVRYPAGGLSGGRRVTDAMGYIDVAPTLRALAGVRWPTDSDLDGIDVSPALRGEAELPDRSWFTFTVLAPWLTGSREAMAVTTSRWKLVRYGRNILLPDELQGEGEDAPTVELYPVIGEPLEQIDLSSDYPGVVALLLDELRAFRALQPSDAPRVVRGWPPPGFVPPERWRIPEEDPPPDLYQELIAAILRKLERLGARG